MKHGKFRTPACKNSVKHESTHRGDDVTHIDILADLSSIHIGGVKHGRVVVVVQHCNVQFALRRLAGGQSGVIDRNGEVVSLALTLVVYHATALYQWNRTRYIKSYICYTVKYRDRIYWVHKVPIKLKNYY